MTHSEVTQEFLKWFISNRPGWFVFPNPTGFASVEKVRYGIPTDGGGSDMIAFGPGGITEFFEIKTHGYPTLSKKQKAFHQKITKQGFKCLVFKEGYPEPVRAQDYRPYAKLYL